MIDLSGMSIKKARDAFLKKEFSPRDLTEAYLENIEKKNSKINAYLEVFKETALSEADEATALYEKGEAKSLSGIPVALKDNILINGKKSSAASKILENFVAPYDATATDRLKKEGVVFLGRANMDEFAMGSSTENSAFGPTRNPLDESRVPGGSSGGSAAAVAMDGALAGFGSDTGGSVRQPASFVGKVGLKPTYGAVSRHGLIALASSLDQIGTITNTVEDAEILFNVIAGTDPMDSTSFYPEKKEEIKNNLTIGIPRSLFSEVSNEVLENVEKAISKFKELGFEIKDIELPNAKYALAVYYILLPAEASSNLARFDGVRYGFHKEGDNLIEDYFLTRGEGFGREPRRRIMIGTHVLSSGYYDSYYGKANSAKEMIRADYEKVFTEGVDLVLTPTTPTPAFKLGEKTSDPLSMYLADIFTVPANISGNPAISLPSGGVEVEGKELPLGIQLVAPHYREDLLFHAGKQFLGA